MREHAQILMLIFCFIAIVMGCKKPYNPPVIANNANYLVVEGVINSGSDSTIITLNRTIPLSSTAGPKPELNAQVTVESEQGVSLPIAELGKGRYGSGPLNLNNGGKYRLRIRTNAGREYLSDFVENKNTPNIDSITYKVQNNGVQFYANAHDPQNATRYYRWDFEETWKYVSFYQSTYKYEGGQPVYRLPNLNSSDNIYECYKTASSHQVLTTSTTKLAQDVVYQQPIDFVEAGSGKISFGYSILLKQYGLTADAYTYWQLLKKNTEQLGSIFDAQPSSSPSNIHSVSNLDEPVIGYVSVCNVRSKRIFVDHSTIDLFTPYYLQPPDAEACPKQSVMIDPADSFPFRLAQALNDGEYILTNALTETGNPIILGYGYAPRECVDCMAKAPFGTNVKPSYWPF
ncbi:MAG TPA: DUF4249 domain-containing protein [Mucilaginibacter sp.]|nr:DUF4249 domain-containing protein [Mucilaginibacter sp.]